MDTPAMLTTNSAVREDDPERELWRAVLEGAIQDLHNPLEKGVALAWFRSKRVDVGSFEWVCLTLGVDASAARKTIVQGMVERLAA